MKFCIICEKYAVFTNEILEKSILLQKVEIEVFLKKKVYNKNITNNHITNYKEV
ncbi:hypothetical protein bthur0007_15580 [Bacillus thuringiensis serovar monterrey BGSC 4AJ1]|nr:hypothetical protein bthur0007_15580 [Bacillus thuringiensis serovar monterrey BGSC 4AJ1]